MTETKAESLDWEPNLPPLEDLKAGLDFLRKEPEIMPEQIIYGLHVDIRERFLNNLKAQGRKYEIIDEVFVKVYS